MKKNKFFLVITVNFPLGLELRMNRRKKIMRLACECELMIDHIA